MLLPTCNLFFAKAIQLAITDNQLVITDLSDTLKHNSDEGYYICCIFLDLSKAFYTVNHKMLLKKLQTYGIIGNMHDILANYLSNRSQFTECNGV